MIDFGPVVRTDTGRRFNVLVDGRVVAVGLAPPPGQGGYTVTVRCDDGFSFGAPTARIAQDVLRSVFRARALHAPPVARPSGPEHGPTVMSPPEFVATLDVPDGTTLDTLDTLRGETGGVSVYRIDMDDGTAYVGLTKRLVAVRVAEHYGLLLPPGCWMQVRNGETPGVAWRIRAGVRPRVSVLASGLEHRQAMDLERAEIAKLSQPLNVAHAGGRTMPLPGSPPPERGAVATYYAQRQAEA